MTDFGSGEGVAPVYDHVLSGERCIYCSWNYTDIDFPVFCPETEVRIDVFSFGPEGAHAVFPNGFDLGEEWDAENAEDVAFRTARFEKEDV